MYSVTSDGAHVHLVDAYADFVMVLVDYPEGSKELYTFDFGRRKLVWSQHKFGVMFDKAQTMISDCN